MAFQAGRLPRIMQRKSPHCQSSTLRACSTVCCCSKFVCDEACRAVIEKLNPRALLMKHAKAPNNKDEQADLSMFSSFSFKIVQNDEKCMNEKKIC